jgi:hypothetical protein
MLAVAVLALAVGAIVLVATSGGSRSPAVDLRGVDWENASVPAAICGGEGAIRLHEGVAIVSSRRWTDDWQGPATTEVPGQVEVWSYGDEVYGDIDGDGHDEAVVPLWWCTTVVAPEEDSSDGASPSCPALPERSVLSASREQRRTARTSTRRTSTVQPFGSLITHQRLRSSGTGLTTRPVVLPVGRRVPGPTSTRRSVAMMRTSLPRRPAGPSCRPGTADLVRSSRIRHHVLVSDKGFTDSRAV